MDKLNTIYWFLDLLTKMTGRKHSCYTESNLWTLTIDGRNASSTFKGKSAFLHYVNNLWIYMDTIKEDRS